MSRIADIQVDSWKDKYIVSANFGDLHIVSNTEFDSIQECLKEMYRLIGREVIKYEAGITSHYSREL